MRIREVIADFGHPLQMLEACHDRIEMQCETLRNLAAHLPVHGCDAQAQQAASNVMRYFDSSGRHHHEDEEQDLFPRMIELAKGEQADRVALLIGQLQREHRNMEQAWLRLREALETLAHGDNAPLDERDVKQFCDMYSDHIASEEKNLIPLASLLLDSDELEAIGRAMAARRGIRL
jgi:hemerythrin-like domain-containing protein